MCNFYVNAIFVLVQQRSNFENLVMWMWEWPSVGNRDRGRKMPPGQIPPVQIPPSEYAPVGVVFALVK